MDMDCVWLWWLLWYIYNIYICVCGTYCICEWYEWYEYVMKEYKDSGRCIAEDLVWKYLIELSLGLLRLLFMFILSYSFLSIYLYLTSHSLFLFFFSRVLIYYILWWYNIWIWILMCDVWLNVWWIINYMLNDMMEYEYYENDYSIMISHCIWYMNWLLMLIDIHSKHILHRDLKPGNILIGRNKFDILVIINY